MVFMLNPALSPKHLGGGLVQYCALEEFSVHKCENCLTGCNRLDRFS